MELPEANFEGQSVLFYVSTPPVCPQWLGEGLVINSPTFQTIGERLFVVGEAPKGSDWSSERPSAIAWDSVIHYVMIPTDEYEAQKNDEPVEVEDVPPAQPEGKKPKLEIGKSGKVSLILIGIVIPIAIIALLVAWTYRILMA